MKDFNLQLLLTVGLLSLPLVWIITDPRSIKERLGEYFTIRGISFALVEINFIFLNYYYKNTLDFPNLLSYSGIPLHFIGLFIAIWAKVTMGKYWGIPIKHDIKKQSKIITNGPFKYSRNPIYLGLILALIGYSLVLKSVFMVLGIVVIVYFYYASIKEEKNLEKLFGEEYLKYKSKVPRFI